MRLAIKQKVPHAGLIFIGDSTGQDSGIRGVLPCHGESPLEAYAPAMESQPYSGYLIAGIIKDFTRR